MKIIYVNCGVKNYLKEDHHSCIRSLCSCEKKARLQNSPRSFAYSIDFLKVVRLVFWYGVVGTGTNFRHELSLARAPRSYDRTSRSLSRYALKSSTCEQVYVFKYARAVKQKVLNEAKNRERELLRPTLPFRWLILRKKTDCFAV